MIWAFFLFHTYKVISHVLNNDHRYRPSPVGHCVNVYVRQLHEPDVSLDDVNVIIADGGDSSGGLYISSYCGLRGG